MVPDDVRLHHPDIGEDTENKSRAEASRTSKCTGLPFPLVDGVFIIQKPDRNK
jgi:hypothetical protein